MEGETNGGNQTVIHFACNRSLTVEIVSASISDLQIRLKQNVMLRGTIKTEIQKGLLCFVIS